jgi:ABC-type nitrate/sulfonate/bicarbonate transport system ATPase subunit
MSRQLVVSELRKRYGDLPVIGGLDLDVAPSEIVAVVGPSGCGKSTLLRLIAGLGHHYKGEILVADEKSAGHTPRSGCIPGAALFPWLDVERNVAFGLRERDDSRARGLVDAALAAVELTQFAQRCRRSCLVAWPAGRARAGARHGAAGLLSTNRSARSSVHAHAAAGSPSHGLDELPAHACCSSRTTSTKAVYLADRVVLLGERPGRVVDVIPLLRSGRANRRDPTLAALRVALLEALHLERDSRLVTA